MTQLGSEEVRTASWTSRQRSSGTTGGTSGSTSLILKLSDSFRKSYNSMSQVCSRVVSVNSKRTMRGPPNTILRNSQLKSKNHLKVI